VAVCDRARSLRPDVAFGADLIAGFPTETDAMFENTRRLVEDCDLTWLHVFPYSPRTGTPAARMPQVAGTDRKARAAVLRQHGDAAVRRHLGAQAGRVLPVLMETDGLGRTPHFAPVAIADAAPGSLISARMTGIAGGRLTGDALPAAA
jgi:threonylcarbamoyladenosine tRNA methylthiotransferase MtaB